MGIELSWLVNRARSFLGQSFTGAIDFTDDDFVRCLEQETLPTISVYLPWRLDVTLDVKRDALDNGVYQIRTPETILGVSRVHTGGGGFGAFPYDPMLFGDMIDRQLVTDRASASQVSLTFKFRPPNVVELYPKGLTYDVIHIEVKAVHRSNLSTFPPGAREVLRDLFLADVAEDALGVRQYFTQLQTPFGEISLNLDRIQAQADRRREIVEQLALKQFKSGGARRVIIA